VLLVASHWRDLSGCAGALVIFLLFREFDVLEKKLIWFGDEMEMTRALWRHS
jgi:hypothetical protein